MDIFDLFAKISLDTSEYEKRLDGAGEKASSFANGLKNGLATAVKVSAAALAAATTAVGFLTKACIDGYAEYEQLVGGVETLFKTSADVVQEYAANAYKTAGLSANEYMETVTSFSASLLQSLGGDTEAAAQVADMAITDMSDNANKMGTSMEMIQNAYQGFAKQNYTMLDNLKLGYGGTKEEMQRLLEDAEKLSGVKYDLSSYADIVEAIHVVQTQMGITGTTAKEAATTIQGSVASMKSAWQNLVVGIADENADLDLLISNFVDSVVTAGENIIPRVEQILIGIGSTIQKLAPIISEQLPSVISNVLPSLLSAGTSLITGLLDGIINALPSLVPAALDVVVTLVNGIIEALPNIASAAVEIVTSLANGISEQLPALIPAAIEAILQLVETLTNPENLSNLVDAAIQLVESLVDGIINSIPVMVEKLPIIVENIVDAIVENLPKIQRASFELVKQLISGIIKNYPQMAEASKRIIAKLISGAMEVIKNTWVVGADFIRQIWEGIKSVANSFDEYVQNLFIGIVEKIFDAFSDVSEWWNNLWAQISQFFVDCWNSIVSFFTETIPAWIQSAIDWFNQLPHEIGYAIGEIIGHVIKFGEDLWSWVTNDLPEMISGIIDWFAKLPGEIWNWLVETKDRVVSWGRDVVEKAKEAASNTVSSVIDWFSKLPERIWNWLSNTIDKIASWGNDMKDKASSAVKDTVGDVISGFSELPHKIYEIGSNIVRDFWNGIVSMGNWIKEKVSDFFGGIVEGITNILSGGREANTAYNLQGVNAGLSINGSFASGLNYVPFDGFIAELHKGEMVVPAKDAQNLRSGLQFGDINIQVDGAKYADERSLARAIAQEIQYMTERSAGTFA